ncbi:hypothetical protein [Fusobacterium sp.]|uniref:hypothetical protein n=1 Tax=Fusobacterium sp. TaxID=68766 RepID=UPI002605CE3F|nr:hypothetical protein [Fusobacterium sp.]
MGLLGDLFKDKNSNINKEIENLNVVIKEKELEIQRLKIETQTIKETYMPPKQVELLEKNLKSLREENNRLKKEKDEFIEKIHSFEKDNSNTNTKKTFSLDKFLYKLSIDEFFSGAKFNLIKEFLTSSGIMFVQEMESVIELPEFKKIKNYSIAKKKYIAFRDENEVCWDNRVSLCRGDKIHKVFKKSRKFVNYLADNNIEFMDEMENFDFETLIVKGEFTKPMIEELETINKEYFKIYKI